MLEVGEHYFKYHDYDESFEWFEKVNERDENNETAKDRLAFFYYEGLGYAQKNKETAYNFAKDLSNPSIHCRVVLAEYYLEKNNPNEAEKVIASVHVLPVNDSQNNEIRARAEFLYGSVLLMQNSLPAAQALYETLLRENRADKYKTKCLGNLGHIFLLDGYANKNYGKAMSCFLAAALEGLSMSQEKILAYMTSSDRQQQRYALLAAYILTSTPGVQITTAMVGLGNELKSLQKNSAKRARVLKDLCANDHDLVDGFIKNFQDNTYHICALNKHVIETIEQELMANVKQSQTMISSFDH
jgi:lipopolysaccharide biosynthesis regulator YciM